MVQSVGNADREVCYIICGQPLSAMSSSDHEMHTGQDEREAGMDVEALAEMADIEQVEVEVECTQE